MVPDIPTEILITLGAGIVLLFTVCIVALLVRRKCQQADLNNQAIYNQSTVSSSGGYATTKPHTRSSWTCTYKAGHQHQVDTHIWETPLPEPYADEYTLPTNTRQPHDKTIMPAAMLDSMEYTVTISNANAHEGTSSKADYTKPVKAPGQRNVAEHPDQEAYTNSSVQTGKRQSQVNYYYYDPSSGEHSEYMAPTHSQDNNPPDTLPAQNPVPDNRHDIPSGGLPCSVSAQEIKECDYRTLIRLDTSN